MGGGQLRNIAAPNNETTKSGKETRHSGREEEGSRLPQKEPKLATPKKKGSRIFSATGRRRGSETRQKEKESSLETASTNPADKSGQIWKEETRERQPRASTTGATRNNVGPGRIEKDGKRSCTGMYGRGTLRAQAVNATK